MAQCSIIPEGYLNLPENMCIWKTWILPRLVGGLNPSEKYESQLGWLETQYMGK